MAYQDAVADDDNDNINIMRRGCDSGVFTMIISIITQANPPDWFWCHVTNETTMPKIIDCMGDWQSTRLVFVVLFIIIFLFIIMRIKK